MAKPRIRKEHTEQVILVARVRTFYPDVIIAAIPNGGNRSSTEGARLKAEGVLAGFPDLIVMEPRGGFHGCVIEMKRVGGTLAPHQRDLLARMDSRGYYIIVGNRGVDIAFRELEDYLQSPLRSKIIDM